ncbi:chitobiase/beta-hexosaminidase C-terminal domain-containing protein [Pseudoramibacter sp.]|jgi:Tfp pilus assembly protein PilF|uniref:chitobiase/beta-hexosaminidase C-terminal domain-containing protein n=1 Tax=Pseudoramibacter sp. TaxID=2034862 RepID=UPI0025FD3C14|nr:chitobiase/beta-hexosaminidase C-terminal domain-containing protein [Pseudoramibacter sp.]MCH4072155.1 chitobiase/beta-hexosaminidase C-terminal domain-containing protein [Pseudoramibacter sp.]MCH4105925.1 chitobiase/beta-hexosaminidase C-terminal domain-containing protein [Pseudoramibacter sp.]
MKCHHCGAALKPGMKFCPQCGQAVGEPKETKQAPKVQKPKKRRLNFGKVKITAAVVVLILVAAGVGAAALLFQNHEYQTSIDLGNRNLDQKAYTAAKASFAEAVKMNDRRPEGYEGQAAVALAKGQTGTAETNLKKAKRRRDTNYGKALRAQAAAAEDQDKDAKALLNQIVIAESLDRRTAVAGAKAARKIGEFKLGEKIVSRGIKSTKDKADLKRLYRAQIDLYIAEGRSNTAVSKLIDESAQATGDADMLKLKKTLLVSRPTFVSKPGHYDIGFKLKLKAGRKSDILYYTTDGSRPNRKSKVYAGAFLLPPGATTVRVVAYNSSGRSGTVLNGVYTVSELAAPKAQDWQDTKLEDMDGVSFSWNAVSGASGYEVQITKNQGDSTENVRPVNWNDQTTSVAVYTSDSGYTLKGKVRAYITVDGKRYYSEWSNEISRDI